MSRGGTGGMHRSIFVLLTRRGSTTTTLGGSHLSPGKRSGLVMTLKSRGTGGGPTGLHCSGVQSCVGVGLSLSAPSRG
jgi:hypothetical protein